jgi:molecular chaperone DnaJ
VRCPTCHGQGDVTHVQRSFIGDIRTTQPCPTCHGYGTVIPDPCAECSGDGRVRATRTINVKIPPGVSTGNRIHLASQGEVGPGGGRPVIFTSSFKSLLMRYFVGTVTIWRLSSKSR